jgi:hypothetical protein
MPLISRGVPAFSSPGGTGASSANDADPSTGWSSGSTPGWLAYDISGAPAADRRNALVAWYAIHAPCYIDTSAPTQGARPIDYTIETNDAPGGGDPPSTGWTAAITITSNRYCGRQHLVGLNGANWVRLNITKGSADATSVFLEMDIQGAPSGASDGWLFMGDSITYMSTTHAWCDIPNLVHIDKPNFFPAVIDAAIGGTNTGTAMAVIDDTMTDFPGRFVVLAYGTNDHLNGFQMEGLVQKVFASGKTPVIPHIPWPDTTDQARLAEVEMQNGVIDQLYTKYPQIVRGPDLWAVFQGQTQWIPPGDVHPNAMGQEELRKAWAKAMEAVYQ